VGPVRYLTLVWPGMPWLWLRGSRGGLVVALAFAVTVDVALVTTVLWSDLVDRQVAITVWAAAAAIWLVATVSAAATFPAAIPRRVAAAEKLFVAARDAYLSRDWAGAETRLRDLLDLAPTDGEAQLLLGTLLRRVGRRDDAREALDTLSRSDSGGPWQREIAGELARLDADMTAPAILPLAAADAPRDRSAAA